MTHIRRNDIEYYLWFNRNPIAEVTISNDFLRKRLRTMQMESILGISKDVVYDHILSKHLNATVIYIGRDNFRRLLKSINVKCKTNIDPNYYFQTFFLTIHVDEETYICPVCSVRTTKGKSPAYLSGKMQRENIDNYVIGDSGFNEKVFDTLYELYGM